MRPVYFDLEATSVDPATARIVEIAMIDGTGHTLLHSLIKPGVSIPPDSTAVHGITDADVANSPSFYTLSLEVERIIEGAILVGYSSRTYDVPLLDAELRRAGRPGLPRDSEGTIDVPEIDLLAVWQSVEPRSLVSAAKRFADVELGDDAHSADADTSVLPYILLGMVGQFDELHRPGIDVENERTEWSKVYEELRARSVPEWACDRDGKFRREDDGTICFGFGKHRGEPVTRAPDYLRWMLGKDFSDETKAWCRRLLGEMKGAGVGR